MIEVSPLRPADRARWEVLSRGYKAFYETELPDAKYEETWRRLMGGDGVYGYAAHLDGYLVGITHYLFHTNVWTQDVCYLQDLFVDTAARGKGVARALIEQVARRARERGVSRLYWLTKQDNATARALYDKVAQHAGFIRYDYRLQSA